jgi:hypothetical protein
MQPRARRAMRVCLCLVMVMLLAAPKGAPAVPWTLSIDGCTFSGDDSGAPLMRTGACGGSYTVDLTFRGITSISTGAFQGMSAIAELNLGRNPLSSLASGAFAGLTGLK